VLRVPPLAESIAACAGLAPLPECFPRLLQQAGASHLTPEELAEAVEGDQSLTALAIRLSGHGRRRVRRSNSPLVNSIDALGAEHSLTLLMLGSVIASQRRLLASVSPSFRQWHIMRSLTISSAAGVLTDRGGQGGLAMARLFGFLQDAGKLAFARVFGATYANLVRGSVGRPISCMDVEERQRLHVSHADVSAAIARGWDLPAEVVSCLFRHHNEDVLEHRASREGLELQAMLAAEAYTDLQEKWTPERLQRFGRLVVPYCRESSGPASQWLDCAVGEALRTAQLLDVRMPGSNKLSQLVENLDVSTGPVCKGGNAWRSVSQSDVDTHTADLRRGLSCRTVKENRPLDKANTIVVIEDDPSIVRTIKLYLASTGVSVVWCRNSEEVRALVENAAAILCDVHLGAETGTEIINALRQTGNSTPVIMISVDNTRDTVIECSRTGIDHYLIKPFDKELLLAKLRDCTGLALADKNRIAVPTR
jgi:CheY-like chemotaxis protein/HD-like signal output (HDOD) protein